MSFNIGIDVGGTFTDIVVAEADGRTVTAKATTTPQDQSDGVMEGVALAAEANGLAAGEFLSRTSRIVHGTTVATNALLEGKGARTGMLTTAGHRDVIEMREGLKPERYNLRMPPPEPLVPRWLRLGVRERLRADGSVETPLDPASLEVALTALAEAEVEAVAVCFLHSWRNPAHERQAAEAVRRRLPGVYVAVSSEVLPEIKEFERFSAAVANAAVGPVIDGYLARLNERLREAGFGGDLFVILSHGGVASVAEACRLAVATALSGPAGGVAAAVALARQGVGEDLITFDMGGTSTDIAVIRDGQPSLSPGRLLAGTRIALPALDIVTLGAGGG
ncbi:MAG: hydantoinase/oxoprolinase family protein, partial [Acetobacteraceae bacterium]|nr:hydantoinase/oxoprolinase family protein [Acetobacteraceae bacterium]